MFTTKCKKFKGEIENYLRNGLLFEIQNMALQK